MPDQPRVRVFCHPVDLVADLDGSLRDIASVVPAGCLAPAGVALAAAYHASRDYLPRNRRRRVHHSPAGVAFPAWAASYPASLPPHPLMPVCAGGDLLAAAVGAGRALGSAVDAWVVYLHHDEPVPVSEEGRVVNAFGDVNPVALCPAAPVVTAYAEAMTRDVAARSPGTVIAEALHHQPFVHGFHHERMFVHRGGLRRFLLGLCFCTACLNGASGAAIEIDALRAWVRDTIDSTAGDIPLPALGTLDRIAAGHAGSGSVRAFTRLRAHQTTNIVARCAAAAREAGVGFAWLDATAALAEPHAEPDASIDPSWQLGCDLAAIARVCDVVTASYADTEESAAGDLDRVTAALGRRPDGAIVRVFGTTADELAATADRIAGLVAREVGWIGLYHYGLAPLHPRESLGRGAARLCGVEGGG